MMRPFTEDDRAVLRRGHRRDTVVELHRPSGYVADLPYSKGDLTWSLSRKDGCRSGRLTLPGYGWFAEFDPALCGWVRIATALEGGSTFDLGEFFVTDATVTRPGGTVEVKLDDWSVRRSQPDAEASPDIGSTTVPIAETVQTYMAGTSQTGVFVVTRDDTGGAAALSPISLKLGGSVWDVLTGLCNQHGCVLVVTGRSTGQIRRFDPLAAPVDDIGGLVTEEKVGWLWTQAVNRVIVQMDAADIKDATFRSTVDIETGPYRYDAQGVGALALVEVLRQPLASQQAADAEAQRLFDRRAGIIRTQAISAVPIPWLEVGDVVAWQPSFMEAPLTAMVETITFPLTPDGTQRITLRDTVVQGVSRRESPTGEQGGPR